MSSTENNLLNIADMLEESLSQSGISFKFETNNMDQYIRNSATPPMPETLDNFIFPSFHDLYLSSPTISFGTSQPTLINNQQFCDVNNNVISQHSFTNESSLTTPISNGRKEKCMSRNAIAARQNREKKKSEIASLKLQLEQSKDASEEYKKKYRECKEMNKRLVERVEYLEKLVNNFPSFMSIIDHMSTLPMNQQAQNEYSSQGLGICFHVKSNKIMGLKFCHHCSAPMADESLSNENRLFIKNEETT